MFQCCSILGLLCQYSVHIASAMLRILSEWEQPRRLVVVDVLMLRACESRGCGHGTLCKSIPTLGTDSNLAASMLVVLAVKYQELMVTEICTRCSKLSNGAV